MIPAAEDADDDRQLAVWADQATAALSAAAPSAPAILVRHLAAKVADARAAHGEDAAGREMQIVETFLRRASAGRLAWGQGGLTKSAAHSHSSALSADRVRA